MDEQESAVETHIVLQILLSITFVEYIPKTYLIIIYYSHVMSMFFSQFFLLY